MKGLVGERTDDVYEERDLRCSHTAIQSIDRPTDYVIVDEYIKTACTRDQRR